MKDEKKKEIKVNIVKIPKGERLSLVFGVFTLAEDAFVEVDDSFSQADMDELLSLLREQLQLLDTDEPLVWSESVLSNKGGTNDNSKQCKDVR